MRGTLSEFTLTQLLQLFGLSERVGTIAVDSDQHHCRLFVAGERVVGLGYPDLDVRAELLACELLPSDTRQLLEDITPHPEVPGLSLVVSNSVEPERWDKFVQRQLEQQLFPVLNAEQGDFEVNIGRLPPAPLRLSLSVQQVILEGSRWEAEMEDFAREGLALDSHWRRAAPGPAGPSLRLSNIDWLVWSALATPTSLRDIARRVCLPDLLTTTTVKRLHTDGILDRLATEVGAFTQDGSN